MKKLINLLVLIFFISFSLINIHQNNAKSCSEIDSIVIEAKTDATITSFSPDTNSGSGDTLFVFSPDGGSSETNHALITFDLSGIPNDVSLLSASINLMD